MVRVRGELVRWSDRCGWYRVQGTGYRVQSTEYRVQSTEYRVPSTGYRVRTAAEAFALNLLTLWLLI